MVLFSPCTGGVHFPRGSKVLLGKELELDLHLLAEMS